MLILVVCVGLWFLFYKKMEMIKDLDGMYFNNLCSCYDNTFISFQHYKYQQENNKKIATIEKYIRVLSKEF